MTSLTLSTSGISGTITGVEVTWSSNGSNNASLSVNVGNTAYTTGNNNATSAASSSNSLITSTFNGNTSGAVSLNFTCTQGIKFQKVKVNYTSGGGGNTPSISLASNTVNATTTRAEGTINVTYNNITNVDAEVLFYESDGATAATYNHDWITAVINSSNNVSYTISANTGAARTAYIKVHQKNTDVYSGLISISQAAVVVDPPTYDLSGGTYLAGTQITLTATGYAIRYTLTTDGSEPAAPTATSGTVYENPIVLSSGGTTKIKAIAVDTYGNKSNVATRTYTVVAPTPTALPFNWAGGVKNTFNALSCVFTNGLGSDYDATNHNPYLIKFDDTNDFILVTVKK